MRTLNINKRELWMVRPTGTTDYVNSSGFKTGEKVKTYTEPVKISVNYRSNDGKLAVVGRGLSFEDDLTITSCTVVLEKDDLIFKSEPTSDYDESYDYIVDRISGSINSVTYGLKART